MPMGFATVRIVKVTTVVYIRLYYSLVLSRCTGQMSGHIPPYSSSHNLVFQVTVEEVFCRVPSHWFLVVVLLTYPLSVGMVFSFPGSLLPSHFSGQIPINISLYVTTFTTHISILRLATHKTCFPSLTLLPQSTIQIRLSLALPLLPASFYALFK